MMSSLDTAESVAKGHPDKVADPISDAILDAHLKTDPNSHVACETVITSDSVVLAGEITSNAVVDTDQITRESIARIGYTDASCGFDLKKCSIHVRISKQSSDIARGVPHGAGDQGLMIGYACRETEEFDEYKGSFMPP